MKLPLRTIAGLMIAVLWFALPGWAQQPKPAIPKTDEPAVTTEGFEEPAVVAILAAKPNTPAECVRAAKTLTDLGHPNVAKPFLKKVLDAKLNPEQLAELGDQFGLPTFYDMAAVAELLPESKQLTDAVIAAVTAKREDAQRIAALIGRLQDPSESKRMEAFKELLDAQTAAVAPLISVLADPARSAEYANVRTVLSQMGGNSRGPLLAIIADADQQLKLQAILTLAEMNDPKTAVFLIEPALADRSSPEVRTAAAEALKQLKGLVPAKSEAIPILADLAKDYFDQKRPVEGDADGRAQWWSWNAAKKQCVLHEGTTADAARVLAAQFARDAYLLAPDDQDIRLLHLTTMLDAAAYANGLDRPLDNADPALLELKKCDAETIDDVLQYAMKQGHPAAATVAARLLGEIGKPEHLLYQGNKPAPLALALQNPDRRLRMAALEAIVRLQPQKPYHGSSHVTAALGFFAASNGMPQAIVAGPNLEQARNIAGMLTSAGYQTDIAANGKDLLRIASKSPDCESVWIDVTIDRPEINMLVQALRHDPRTASLRTALLARAGYDELARRVAERDPMAMAFAQPQDQQTVQWQLDQLATLAPQEFVPFDVRQQQAAKALDLLAELSASPAKIYDLRLIQDALLTALANPRLSQKAVAVLANINSAESQRALVDAAGLLIQPIELRIAAAGAFCRSVQKFGLLLTSDEIKKQYQRYNESEKQDAATQRVFSMILDGIEAPSQSNH